MKVKVKYEETVSREAVIELDEAELTRAGYGTDADEVQEWLESMSEEWTILKEDTIDEVGERTVFEVEIL